MASPLSPEFVQELLGVAHQRQTGPIRFYDKEMRCGSRGCSSPTYIKWRGMPECYMHTLRLANDLFLELGVNE